ncbi:MAG: CotH kinase family protein [Isosphaeraceae bacterium]
MSRKTIATTCLATIAMTSVVGFGAWKAQEPGGPPFGGGGRPGFGPGPGGPTPGFGLGMFLAPRVIELADGDGDGRLTPEEASKAAETVVREADVEKRGTIDAVTLGRAVNRRLGPPPGFGPDLPPGDFGPGTFLAPRLLEAADANKDGRLTPEEASRAAGRFVREAQNGVMDEPTLAAALNQSMSPPPGLGPGGPGGPMGQPRELVKEFDKNGDQRLDATERALARESLKTNRPPGGGRFGPPMGFGPPPGFGVEEGPVVPGPRVFPADVAVHPDQPLYEPTILRTLFLDFEGTDWERELADFYRSDVDVPATLTVDGREYPGVGVHFRGMSSYFTVQEGRKRSLNVSLDHTTPDQRLDGHKTLNLLNAHEDPTFLHTVLYSEIARRYIPAPRANFVRLVINGESWGLYVNAQQFDKVFLNDFYKTDKGARWKVPGNPGADGGLRYLGDDLAEYKRRYEIKSADAPNDWRALITLCETLEKTPADQLEEALKPMLDVDGALWFLALEVALVNGDGYWTRASDYSIYRDPKGIFHIIPHDMNETLQPAMMFGPGGPGGPGFGPGGPGFGPGGPGFGPGGGPLGKAIGKGRRGGRRGPGGGPGGFGTGGAELDPLVALDDPRKPLRGKLLAVPALRTRYLERVRAIAEKDLDWKTLGPLVSRYRALIEKEVEADTRKLTSLAAFQSALAEAPPAVDVAKNSVPGPGRRTANLKEFVEGRRRFLLNHPEIKKLSPTSETR